MKAEPADLQSAPFGHLGTRPGFGRFLCGGWANIRPSGDQMQGHWILTCPTLSGILNFAVGVCIAVLELDDGVRGCNCINVGLVSLAAMGVHVGAGGRHFYKLQMFDWVAWFKAGDAGGAAAWLFFCVAGVGCRGVFQFSASSGKAWNGRMGIRVGETRGGVDSAVSRGERDFGHPSVLGWMDRHDRHRDGPAFWVVPFAFMWVA